MEQHEACAAALLGEPGIEQSWNSIASEMRQRKRDVGYEPWYESLLLPLAAAALNRRQRWQCHEQLFHCRGHLESAVHSSVPRVQGYLPHRGVGGGSGWVGRGNASGIVLLSNLLLITEILSLRWFPVASS